MRICSYENGTFKCKNWILNNDEDIVMCPVHSGITKRIDAPASIREERFEAHSTLCDTMSLDELSKHILQLDSLLEDVKLRQQAAHHSRNKQLKEAIRIGDEQKIEEIRAGTFSTRKRTNEAKVSKEEKEIQNLMKKGLSRAKAMQLLDMN